MGNFFNNLGAKMQSFMVGRNGSDKLARWALGAAVIAAVINMFFGNVILYMLCYALLFYSVYRMFSRNVTARQAENHKFEQLLDGFGSKRRGRNSGPQGSADKSSGTGAQAKSKTAAQGAEKPRPHANDDSKIKFACEQCGQSLSVPKGRGKLKVTCPKCHHQQTIDS